MKMSNLKELRPVEWRALYLNLIWRPPLPPRDSAVVAGAAGHADLGDGGAVDGDDGLVGRLVLGGGEVEV